MLSKTNSIVRFGIGPYDFAHVTNQTQSALYATHCFGGVISLKQEYLIPYSVADLRQAQSNKDYVLPKQFLGVGAKITEDGFGFDFFGLDPLMTPDLKQAIDSLSYLLEPMAHKKPKTEQTLSSIQSRLSLFPKDDYVQDVLSLDSILNSAGSTTCWIDTPKGIGYIHTGIVPNSINDRLSFLKLHLGEDVIVIGERDQTRRKYQCLGYVGIGFELKIFKKKDKNKYLNFL